MAGWFLGAASALWLGILTSISPCPLATNVVAISYVGRRVGNPRQVFLAGVLYTLGRSLTYLILGVLLVGSLLSAPSISQVLQKYIGKILGPLLILAGMLLLELLRVNIPGWNIGEKMQRQAEAWGIWGAGALGVVFALSFCPISAALFFGSLIPLAFEKGSCILLPSPYGVGTGLSVFAVAALIALGTHTVGKVLNQLALVERWARRVTGVVFIVVGIYYCLTHIFGIPF
jgi:cytochrome c-type biogenesis protein